MCDKTRPSKEEAVPPGKTNWAALDEMSDVEAEARARSDPDAQPLPEGQTMRRMTAAKRVRFDLRLSREEFAERYHIPQDTITAWERRELEPDAVAKAFLDAIAADPEGVARALAKKVEAAE